MGAVGAVGIMGGVGTMRAVGGVGMVPRFVGGGSSQRDSEFLERGSKNRDKKLCQRLLSFGKAYKNNSI